MRLTFTAKENCPYIIRYNTEVYTSNKRRQVSTRVQIDDTETVHESNVIPSIEGANGWGSFSGEYIKTFTEGEHYIDLDFKANGSSVSTRRSRIVVTEITLGN